MFDKLFEYVSNIKEDTRIDEVLTASQIKQMRDELATPEILPCAFDITIPAWLARIEMWGKVTYYHKDPEKHWGKRKVTKGQFVKRISDETLNKMFGIWSIKKNGLTKCTFYRDYIGTNNKHYREQFIVDVKLKKELK